ncbi:Hypothetical protein NTJ_09284 [Nesidiocoris tenuis]|uniref:Uncharacterized protein n=1 Tax=Nesidiocoris tenuis TaxID=355587 RepID=A0ABN7AWY7_9HEMI|nr:Hypothetical protein NTJ_09284 [Nesidiocoris tenuis]
MGVQSCSIRRLDEHHPTKVRFLYPLSLRVVLMSHALWRLKLSAVIYVVGCGSALEDSCFPPREVNIF